MKKVLKRLLVILLCVSVLCFPMSFSFATTSSLLPANVVTWDDVSADGKALAEAYVNMIQSGSNGQIKEMFKSMTDVPLNYFKLLSDGSWVLSPVENIYYYFKDGEFYVHEEGHGGGGGTRPGEEDSGHGGGGGDRPVTSSDIYIPSDSLVDYIEEQNTLNSPKGKDLFIQSYRSENFLHLKDISAYIPIFNDSKKTPFNDLYLIPFYQDENCNQYFVEYQYHLYYAPIDDPNAVVSLKCDVYKYTPGLGNVLETQYSKWIWDFADFEIPFCLGLEYDCETISHYTIEGYSDNITTTYKNFSFEVNGFVPIPVYYSPSSYDNPININSSSINKDKFIRKYSDSTANPNEDIGFICSHSLIERTYADIDTSKIEPNQVVNITGDTIYDYSITNPDTGASTTINEYVTNNYYYPESPSTSEPSGGGSGVGGNVNVGGNINVGGQVDVNIGVSVPDININVNQGSGAGGSGTGINPDDILDGSSVDLDKYYDDAVSQASGVRSFLTQFFDFLPAEIVALLALLISVAIVCRLFGR